MTQIDVTEVMKLVVVMRHDLGMSKGKIASQACYAAVACSLDAEKNCPEVFAEWEACGRRVVILRADSLGELEDVLKRAPGKGVFASLMVDAGLTQVAPMTPTCVGLGPDTDMAIDEVTEGLRLF